jgi:FG-GAP-like repeat
MKTKNYTALFLTLILTFAFAATANAVAPSNDNLAQAEQIILTGDLVTVHSTNVDATREPSEPIHYFTGNGGESSVWYKWTATETRAMQIELAENFSSSFSVYKSSTMVPTFASLTRINSSTDASGYGGKYQTRFLSETGTTYYIAIDSSLAQPRAGIFDLTVRRFHYRYALELNAGDMRSSVAVFRPSEGMWYCVYETRSDTAGFNIFTTRWGQQGDTPVPADYQGFGRSGETVTRNIGNQKVWMFAQDFGLPAKYISWGLATDTPLAGDFDRDGRADLVALRKGAQNLEWYVRQSTDGNLRAFTFGLNTDKPVLGDFDGDGATDVAVTRNTAQGVMWYMLLSDFEGGGATYSKFMAMQFGSNTDLTVAADYDGDLKTDIAVYRPSEGNWYIIQSSNNQLKGAQFGIMGDIPEPSDHDGDGKADLGVYRPSSGDWYNLNSGDNTMRGIHWGGAGDIAISAFNTLIQ